MSGNSRQYIITVLVLTASLFAIARSNSAVNKWSAEIGIKQFPSELSEWKGHDLDIDESVYDILETRQVLIRKYTNKEGDYVVLSIVYASNNRQSIHPPEYCYLGGGAEIINKSKEDIFLENNDVLKVNKMVMRDSFGTIKAWYWYMGGGKFMDNYYLQQIYSLKDALKGKGLNGALIRVSVRDKTENSEKKTKAFIKEAVPLLKNIL